MTHLRLYDPSTHTVVPREPTYGIDKMSYAGASALPAVEGVTGDAGRIACKVYTAMLAAAPDASRPLPTRERLAVEIYNSHCPQTDIVWYLLPDKDKNIYRRIADAVLALLAEREKGE